MAVFDLPFSSGIPGATAPFVDVEIVHFALLLKCVSRLETLDDIDDIVTHRIALLLRFWIRSISSSKLEQDLALAIRF